jgi:hypothetical protein
VEGVVYEGQGEAEMRPRFYVTSDKTQPIRRYPQEDMYLNGNWGPTGIPEGTPSLIQVPDTLCLLINVKGFDTV